MILLFYIYIHWKWYAGSDLIRNACQLGVLPCEGYRLRKPTLMFLIVESSGIPNDENDCGRVSASES